MPRTAYSSNAVCHWFGAVKNFRTIFLFLRVLSPDSQVCVARGCNLSSVLVYGNHLSIASHAAVVRVKVCTDVKKRACSGFLRVVRGRHSVAYGLAFGRCPLI